MFRYLQKHIEIIQGRSIDFTTLIVKYNGDTMLLEQLHRYQIKKVGKSRTWHKK